MKITIYELMGLIKNNKAPKKIKIYDDIFELSITHYYLNGILEKEQDLYYKISGGYATLNDTVEILSEENGWEDIEELQEENKELFVENMKLKDKLEQQRKEYQETYKDVREEIKELKQQNNILTEFEKWLEEEMKRKNSRWEQFHNQINTQELVLERLNAQIVFIDCCLKRIQELKEGKK